MKEDWSKYISKKEFSMETTEPESSICGEGSGTVKHFQSQNQMENVLNDSVVKYMPKNLLENVVYKSS